MFLTDCIAVLPFDIFAPRLIFLRLLKLLKIGTY
jgi:hypothetical protein